MKRATHILAAIVASTAFLLHGCGASKTTAEDWEKKKEAAVKDIDRQIDEIQKNLSDLKLRAEKMGEQAAAKYQQALIDAQPQIDTLKKQSEELKSTAKEKWDEAKVKMDQGLGSLKRTYEQLKSDLTS